MKLGTFQTFLRQVFKNVRKCEDFYLKPGIYAEIFCFFSKEVLKQLQLLKYFQLTKGQYLVQLGYVVLKEGALCSCSKVSRKPIVGVSK